MTAASTPTRPTIVLSGFFGRGNCGDEALLQSQYECLASRFDVVISVDERGACDGFWDRYPYDRCRIVHQANLAVLGEPEVVAIHVGGGGLPHGFNAAQVVHARSHGKPAVLSGVDCPMVSPAASAALRAYYGLFDFVSVRSAAAWRAMQALVPGCHHGGDWAFGLPTAGPLPVTRARTAVLTLREFPIARISTDYVARVAALIGSLQSGFDRVVLLPCCPEDDRFSDRVPPAARLHRERHWWEPRRVQREIAAAELVVSMGRLHPLVFAANVGTPAVFVEPLPGDARWPTSGKVRELCAEHGWPWFDDVRLVAAGLAGAGKRLAGGCGFASGTRDRWLEMSARVGDHLGQAVARPPRAGFHGLSAA